MTYDEFATEVSRYSYKPGYRFGVYKDDASFTIITTLYVPELQDAYHPGRTVPVALNKRISLDHLEHVEPDYVRYHLGRMIQEFEAHEAQEWFRKDGVLVNDPHGKDLDG